VLVKGQVRLQTGKLGAMNMMLESLGEIVKRESYKPRAMRVGRGRHREELRKSSSEVGRWPGTGEECCLTPSVHILEP
jgi:hypothetical protein